MSAIQPTISTVGKVSLSIRLERAATASCIVDLTTAISGESHRLRRLDDVCGSRTFSPRLSQDFGLVGIHSSHQHGILCRLGSGQAQAVVLLLQSSDVVCIQRIENSTAVCVLVLNHITGGVLNGVLHGAGLGCHIVANAVNGSLGGAAAVADLMLHAVDTLLDAVEAVLQAVVHVIEPVAQAAFEAAGETAKN